MLSNIRKFSDLACAYKEMCYSAYCQLVFGVEQLPSQATVASVCMMVYKTWISISSFNLLNFQSDSCDYNRCY